MVGNHTDDGAWRVAKKKEKKREKGWVRRRKGNGKEKSGEGKTERIINMDNELSINDRCEK